MDLRAIGLLFSLCFGVWLGCGEVGPRPDGGPDAPADDLSERSGSRLKRRGHDLDGTQVFDGLYDSARGERCGITEWSDGASYCTPIQSAGTLVFADAACTTKVGLSYTGPCQATGPRYFTEYEATRCGGAVSGLYTAGAASSATQFYRPSETGCLGPYDLDDGAKLVALGPAVATSELVAITRSSPVGSNRVRHVFDESADGLRIATAAFHDSELATNCFLSAENETTWSCIPQTVQYAGQYADAACSQLTTLSYFDCPTEPFAQHNEAQGCRYPRYSVYRTGPELDTSSGYDSSSGTCMAQDYGDEVRIHAVGERVALPIAIRTAPAAGPRIQHVTAGIDTDTLTVPYAILDTGIQADCAIGTATDGVERCLPYGAFAQQSFRDAACTIPVTVFRVYRGAATCDELTPPAFGRTHPESPDPCQSLQAIHRLGPEVKTPLYQQAAECVLVTTQVHGFYELGAVVPPAELVPAVPFTEP